MSTLQDSEDEEKLQVVRLEDIPKKIKLFDTWLPNSLLRITIDFQEFDYFRTATIVRCLLCLKEFDPSRNGVNINNLMQHVKGKHLLVRRGKRNDEKPTLRQLRQPHVSSFFRPTAKNKKQRLNSAVVQAAERACTSVSGLASIDNGNVDSAVSSVTNPSSASILENKQQPLCQKLVRCRGCSLHSLLVSRNVSVPESLDFAAEYPFQVHSERFQEDDELSCSVPVITWRVSTDGNFFNSKDSEECNGWLAVPVIEKEDRVNFVCAQCSRLKYNTLLFNFLKGFVERVSNSSRKKYTSDAIAGFNQLVDRRNGYRDRFALHRLDVLNVSRKVLVLSRCYTDSRRFIEAIASKDVPRVSMLIQKGLNNGHSFRRIEERLTRASQFCVAGKGKTRRKFIPRSRSHAYHENGVNVLSQSELELLEYSFVTWKFGGQRLAKTSNMISGTLSVRSTQTAVQRGRLFVPRLVITPSIQEEALRTIDLNMERLIFNAEFQASCTPTKKTFVILMEDGIAIDEKFRVDFSVVPNQIVGGCRHCVDCTYNSAEDAEHYVAETRKGKYHLAKEVDVVSIGFVNKDHTAIWPLYLSPTCKKDNFLEESTGATKFLIEYVYDKYITDPRGQATIGPLGTVVSDGAPQFRKGMGKAVNMELPPLIRVCFAGCQLFNLTGGLHGCTVSCDLDHIGKRTRARAKNVTIGIRGRYHKFRGSDFASFLVYFAICGQATATKMMNPPDGMDVELMARTLQALGEFDGKSNLDLSEGHRRRQDATVANEIRELSLLGRIFKLM